MATLMSYFAPPIAGEWGDEAEDNTDGVPVLRTTNFTADGRLSYDDLTYRSIDTEKKKNKILQPGDIIIEKSGGTPKKPVGRCVYFDRDDDYDYFCSNFTAILRANTEDVNTKYLWYLLQEHYKTRQCLKYQYKTNGIANLDIKDYLSHKEVELPPREVQDKRVEAMDYSQYLLDLHQDLLEIMDNAVKSRFIEMFGDPVTNPMGWTEHRLEEYIVFLTSGSRGWSKYFSDDGEIFITIKNVKNNRITLDNVQHVIPPNNAEAQRTKVREGDLLISITADLGRTGVVSREIEKRGAYINQHLTCIRLKQEQINPSYVSYFMESDAGKRQFDAKNQSAVKAGLNFDAIKSLKLLVPPISIQNEYVSFTKRVDKSKLTIQKSMDNLQELRDSLLQEYFG